MYLRTAFSDRVNIIERVVISHPSSLTNGHRRICL